MVFEWNDEFCKVILRKDINSEPHEVIDIVDLLEAWQFYKVSKTKLPIELQEAYFQGYQEGREYEQRQLEARFNERFGKIKSQIDEFFRQPTEEEMKSVCDYIDSISIPTGVNVFDLIDKLQTERGK